jgi:hypothetical protein
VLKQAPFESQDYGTTFLLVAVEQTAIQKKSGSAGIMQLAQQVGS